MPPRNFRLVEWHNCCKWRCITWIALYDPPFPRARLPCLLLLGASRGSSASLMSAQAELNWSGFSYSLSSGLVADEFQPVTVALGARLNRSWPPVVLLFFLKPNPDRHE